MVISKKERLIPYIFLIPALLGLGVFRLAPIFSSLYDSFFTVSFARGGAKIFVGLENYIFSLQDPVFQKAMGNTVRFLLTVVPLQILWAFAMALLVYRPGKGVDIYRTIFFIPFTISLAITSTIWGIMYNPNGGLVNSLLAVIGLGPFSFLTSANEALGSVIFIVSWRSVGYWMIFLISGLQNISPSLYESAWIDGARAWQSFLYITLPMMKRTFLFVIVADTTQNFLMFTPMYILTGGGPENSTNIIMYEAFRNVFVYADRGVGNAMVMIMILLILCVVALEFKFMKTKE